MDHWQIWLDPDDAALNVGLCIGAGASKEEARKNAITTLAKGILQLIEP
jgi:hypothetical protein